MSDDEDNKAELDEMTRQLEKRSLFLDPSGKHGDYSKGFFYEGRRRFLSGAKNVLEPPELFMTYQQRKSNNLVKKANDGGEIKAFRKITMSDHVDKRAAGRKLASKTRSAKSKTFYKKYSSIDPDDWIFEIQAGCPMYTNKATGEVVQTCPWETNDWDNDSIFSHSEVSFQSQGFGFYSYSLGRENYQDGSQSLSPGGDEESLSLDERGFDDELSIGTASTACIYDRSSINILDVLDEALTPIKTPSSRFSS
jgi:hypothetical protein